MSHHRFRLKPLLHCYDVFPYLKQTFLLNPQNASLIVPPSLQQNSRKSLQSLPSFQDLFPTAPGESQHLSQHLFTHFLQTQHPTKQFMSNIDVEHTSSDRHFDIAFTKASGAGGQHRNKTQSCVRITHLVSGVQGEASEDRNQVKNRKSAWHRLFLNMALKIRMPVLDMALKEMTIQDAQGEGAGGMPAVPPSQEAMLVVPENTTLTHPMSHFWNERVLNSKLSVAVTSQAYPEIISDLLDVFNQFQYNMKDANEYLAETHNIALSTNQLIGTLKKDKHVWAYVNQEREKLSLPPLR